MSVINLDQLSSFLLFQYCSALHETFVFEYNINSHVYHTQ